MKLKENKNWNRNVKFYSKNTTCFFLSPKTIYTNLKYKLIKITSMPLLITTCVKYSSKSNQRWSNVEKVKKMEVTRMRGPTRGPPRYPRTLQKTSRNLRSGCRREPIGAGWPGKAWADAQAASICAPAPKHFRKEDRDLPVRATTRGPCAGHTPTRGTTREQHLDVRARSKTYMEFWSILPARAMHSWATSMRGPPSSWATQLWTIIISCSVIELQLVMYRWKALKVYFPMQKVSPANSYFEKIIWLEEGVRAIASALRLNLSNHNQANK